MRADLPSPVREILEKYSVDEEDVLASIETDINSYGKYEEQWLIATSHELLVIDPDFDDGPLVSFSLDEIQALRSVAAVGSGLLQIRVEDVWLDLMRFSNRLKHRFDRIVSLLDHWKRGDRFALPDADRGSDPQRCPKCGMMLEVAGETCPRCVRKGAALHRTMDLLRPYWKSTAALLVLLLIGILLDMAWPLFTRYLVDHVLTADGNVHKPFHWMEGRGPRELLLWVVVALALVQVGRGVVNFLSGRITSVVSNAMTFDIRAKIVRKLENLGLAYYSRHETGSLVGRTAYDTDAIQGFLTQITSGFVMQFLLVVFSFGMMFSLEPRLALWAVVPAPLVIGGAILYWRAVHPHAQKVWDRTSKQAGLLNGLLSGIRVVKAFGQEDREYARFQEISADVRQTRQQLDQSGAFFYPLMAIIFQVGGWIIWYVGGASVLDSRITLGTLIAFFGYLSLFYGPLGSLTNLTTWMTQFTTQMHRIFEILDTPETQPPSTGSVEPSEMRGEIEFRDVTFGYSRGTPVLRNLSLRIEPGERVGIVGRSGSGKTSLTNLICRFYDPDSGEVRIDGTNVRDFSKSALRRRIGVVLQEPFLFRGSLLENIQYGRPSASLEEVIEAARAANAHDFVLRHPLAYDTFVGERGQELSGGERQRVSIARALLCRTPILILDEATSSVDTESELAIQTALDEITKSCTSIFVAHRLKTLRGCDRIYVLENGEIFESGTHAELMAKKGRYAEWVRIQEGTASLSEDAPEEAATTDLRPVLKTRFLNPESDLLERGVHHELQVKLADGERYRGCFALRCFPVHHPGKFISIRHIDAQNRSREIGIVHDLSAWPGKAQKAVLESLERRYFFHTIKRIHSIRKIAQFLEIKAATDLGTLEFTIRHEADAAQSYGKKGKLFLDLEDNLYVISDLKALRRSDRKILNRYIYW